MIKKIFDGLPWHRKIAVLRTAKGVGQKQAASLCMTSSKCYWQWEKGRSYPRLISRKALSDAYGVKVEDISSNEDVVVTD